MEEKNLKKRIGIITGVILILILLIFIKIHDTKKEYGFFAWMDAYIATETNAENTIAITLFYNKKPFETKDIVSINFSDIPDKIGITGFTVDDIKGTHHGYSSSTIILDFTAINPGVYTTSGVDIMLNNNKVIHYPVGSWTFDVNIPKEEVVVDSLSAQQVVSNGFTAFSYDYSVKNEDAVITKIYYGNNLYVSNEDKVLKKGVIDIQNEFQAPLIYIKSKIEVSLNNKKIINSGNGYYCGLLAATGDEVIKKSKNHNQIKNN